MSSHPFYHRRAGVVKSFASPGIEHSGNCPNAQSVAVLGEPKIQKKQLSNGTYSAHHAHKLYRKRRKNCGRKPKLKSGAAREYVLAKMALRWSPEQIAGRAKRNKEPFSISFPTIYRAIDKGVLPPR